ncbi:MAG: tRNA lysidine(34) synthetase TilS, partial [Nitrospira sp.]|nr:tRNA lysidine(34) synthetase TilS [Nitrospira sp.]
HLDKSTFSTPLTVRSWLPGDLFYPKGLGGKRKKLQDFFSDIKIPRSQRPLVPLLVAPEGIVCVGAFRADERFRVTAETTSTVVAQISTTTVSQYD